MQSNFDMSLSNLPIKLLNGDKYTKISHRLYITKPRDGARLYIRTCICYHLIRTLHVLISPQLSEVVSAITNQMIDANFTTVQDTKRIKSDSYIICIDRPTST